MNEQIPVPQRNSAHLKRVLIPYCGLGAAVMLIVEVTDTANASIWVYIGQFMGDWIPTIRNLPAATRFEALARAYLVTMWLALPFVLLSVARNWQFFPRMFYLKRGDQWFVVGCSGVIASWAFVCIWFFPNFTYEHAQEGLSRGAYLVQLATNFTTGLLIVGSLFFSIAAGCIGIAIKIFYLVGIGYQPKKPE